MPDLETPEQFAERLFGLIASDAAAAIRARDRQVREAALAEAAAHMDRNAKAERASAFNHTAEFAERVAGYFRSLATGAPDGG